MAFRVAISRKAVFEAIYTGGVIVNEGAGWKLDQGASEALRRDIPWAVAGLPDGGAAISASGGIEGAAMILERESGGDAWQPTPSPYPGAAYDSPGSLDAVS